MKYPKRKTIRLKDYDYGQNDAFFVTVCTHDRVKLFGEIETNGVGAALRGRPFRPDKMIERWLFELENKFENVKIDSYCVMPDHIHFILLHFTGDHIGSPLPDMVGWFKTMTTNAYIRGVKSGIYPRFNQKVWQRGYYEHIIRNDEDMFEAQKYILGNPAKWYESKMFKQSVYRD